MSAGTVQWAAAGVAFVAAVVAAVAGWWLWAVLGLAVTALIVIGTEP